MSDLNNVTLTGRLTADAVKSEINGKTKVDFTICVNSYFSKTDYANFFYLTYWNEAAERILPYLKKGQCVNITAALKQDRWEKNGEKHQKISIVLKDVQLQSSGIKGFTSDEKDLIDITNVDFDCGLPED